MSQEKPKPKLSSKIEAYLLLIISLFGGYTGGGLFANAMRRKSKSLQCEVIASLLLLVTLVVGGKGLSEYLKSRPLELHGKLILGTVIDVQDYMKNHVPLITYNFMPPHGHIIQGEGFNWEPTRLGDKVTITYLPDDPTRSLLTNDLERDLAGRFGWAALTGLFAALTASAFGASFYYRRYLHKKTDA